MRWAAANGVEGLKLGAHRPEIMAALLDQAKRHQLGSTTHLQQTGVAQMNALDAARLGLQTVTHFYGHFEALFQDYVVQPWPVGQIKRQRADALRAGRAPVGQDLPAGQSRGEGLPRGTSHARHHVRSDDDGVCRGPRPDEETGKPEWIGGIKYTIKDGIVYDAKEPLADMAAMVDQQKQASARTTSQR